MRHVLEFSNADLDRPLTSPGAIAETAWEMFDGETPVRTEDAAERLGRNFRIVKMHLHRADKLRPGDSQPASRLGSATFTWKSVIERFEWIQGT